jgi:hypothetical protein
VLHVPDCYRLRSGIPTCSTTRVFCHSPGACQHSLDGPTTPTTQPLTGLPRHRFRLRSAFAHHYSRNRMFLSLPPGTEMFQFPGLPQPALWIQAGVTGHDSSRVSPFGHPRIDGWLAPTLGLSQLPTSFVGSRCLGIHPVHFPTCRKDTRARYRVLKDHTPPTGGAPSEMTP